MTVDIEPAGVVSGAPDSGQEATREPAPPVESRFLFVNIAAQRAKQLRRGAQPRVPLEGGPKGHKLERVAMLEVEQGRIPYTLPPPPGQVREAA
ncbi:MAG TPA: DNA-directed RNA polymerase subunit omega [Vicinamibacterales bacterium]|nr:DNA-directed RNA polymerase subunit omega [Vicinamibacterales bacterium]